MSRGTEWRDNKETEGQKGYPKSSRLDSIKFSIQHGWGRVNQCGDKISPFYGSGCERKATGWLKGLHTNCVSNRASDSVGKKGQGASSLAV